MGKRLWNKLINYYGLGYVHALYITHIKICEEVFNLNIQWYKIATQTGVIKEALRTLKGYDGETEDRELLAHKY